MSAPAPLAERMRPTTLAELCGQEQALGAGKALRAAIETGQTGSLILFGPPGVGKTTLARILAERSGLHFVPFSAVLSGIKEVREAMALAEERRATTGQGTLLFVDEIHRFNKAQQDAFLPHVESGRIVLVGATTENPSFSVIGALLSRCRVVKLEPLPDAALQVILDRALGDRDQGLGARGLRLTAAARQALCVHAAGDARKALVILEAAAAAVPDGVAIEERDVREAMQHRALRHDKGGDFHFDLLSALHKSLRNSDPHAAIYWLTRFLECDADPLQAARRLVAMAAEDIGLADPMALQVAVAALSAANFLGMPEARLPLAEATLYLACAPKSNSVLRAIDAATAEIRQNPEREVPLHLRNAVTGLMAAFGHGAGYLYAHDHPEGVTAMECLPEALRGQRFYVPGERGFEQKIAQRLR